MNPEIKRLFRRAMEHARYAGQDSMEIDDSRQAGLAAGYMFRALELIHDELEEWKFFERHQYAGG